jgi:hypothetical protein
MGDWLVRRENLGLVEIRIALLGTDIRATMRALVQVRLFGLEFFFAPWTGDRDFAHDFSS